MLLSSKGPSFWKTILDLGMTSEDQLMSTVFHVIFDLSYRQTFVAYDSVG